MLDWLRNNWLLLTLLLIIAVLLVAFLRSAGGLASARRTLLGLLPRWGRFGTVYLNALRERERELPALITRENLRNIELIKAFALLRLEVPGMAVDPDVERPRRGAQEEADDLFPDFSWRGRLFRWWRERSACTSPSNSPGGAIWASPRLLILGGPGSGKTTLLRHIALICASEKIGRSSLAQGNRVRDVYGWPQPLFPIFIPLRQLARHCPDWPDRPLLDSYQQALGQILGPDLRRSCRPGWFTHRLSQGGCILLIDGFDELREETARDTMAARIRDLERLSRRRRNHIVVTSRPIGYEGQLDADFERRDVAPLSRAEIHNLITARYTAIHARERTPDWQPTQRAQGLAERLQRSASLMELSRAPLLLALIIGIDYVQESGELPEERYRVYELAVDYLLERWELQRMRVAGEKPATPSDGRASLNKDEKLRLAAELAWAMFTQSGEQHIGRAAVREGVDAYLLISRRRAAEVVAGSLREILAERGAPRGPELERSCREQTGYWLAELGERGGLLQGESDADSLDAPIQFAHKSIQEFLAAQAVGQMVARDKGSEHENRYEKLLLQRWENDDWQEVIRFYAASHAARPVVEFLLIHATPRATLLAGWCLYERPRNPPDQATQARVRTALRGLFDAPPEVLDERAGEGLLTLLDSLRGSPTLDTCREQIIRAATISAAPALRIRACELLAPAAADPVIQGCLLSVATGDPDYRPRLAVGTAIAPYDPRFQGAGWLPDLIEVLKGDFVMGEGEQKHTLDLPTYWIGRYPVTVAQWRVFAESGAYQQPEYWTKDGWRYVSGKVGEYRYQPQRRRWLPFRRNSDARPREPVRWHDPGPGENNLPITEITWHEAVAYCRWLSAQTGADYRLPTEAQWEKAARGTHGLIYPWGNQWESGLCNSKELGLNRSSPVGSFPDGASPYGAEDMAGNVWEWCATKYGKPYPYNLNEDEWDAVYLEGEDNRCMRGGAFYWDKQFTRGSDRGGGRPRHRLVKIGLRVASCSPRPRPGS
jgi:formylglycine-generating enzyme required for sulfatase activity/energy-coupling factor transporter ATP-binding protein EcfA2